jgi:hypothetical protein
MSIRTVGTYLPDHMESHAEGLLPSAYGEATQRNVRTELNSFYHGEGGSMLFRTFGIYLTIVFVTHIFIK